MADAKYAEHMEYLKQRLAESKKVQATRGKDAYVAAQTERLAKGPATWRQLKGVPLMIHEIKHVGNKPFMWGFATVAVTAVYAQMKFTDEMKANSDYWKTFHAEK
uniref:Uncharacterized protein n=1 Tax=Helicotheca tamesis TaxID=374047 RepID=A0A7S2ICY6_9STRA|mmetsp:Transcript_7619/g.10379  ORF Transcript_7619/g.10379 Transcript_7619/m.10379 type:complete len:105 (+) Transcript_7619:117-431(+)|eukprot:CAMPEP_0185724320 /NCGR_PEP_ID=MMETSP1171-20130828/832_1 /TAXON_ID=374046 /ORGANISM="Helicotheca tamensis, Strain CCMP826" /LENGTH=104 /DNA_ID=CAMNT_0028392141 /DNA_START=79 /DNA_END=393 /DNA_ORIENTATION=-